MLVNNLKEVRLHRLNDLNLTAFTVFINQNRQLEILHLNLEDRNFDLLNVLDGLNDLKTLDYALIPNGIHIFPNDLPTIKLNALETLKIRQLPADVSDRVLRAITCNELKSLSLINGNEHKDIPDDVINRNLLIQNS